MPVIVWPFRSSVTLFVTSRASSTDAAATSFRSVTSPPASSASCRSCQVIGDARHTSPFAMPTKQPGSSLEKHRSSPAAAPEVRTTESPAVGTVSVDTPMDAPAERPSTTMTTPSGRQTLLASPTELVLPETTGFPETVNEPLAYTNTPPPLAELSEIMPPFIVNVPVLYTYTPPPMSAELSEIVPPFIVNVP